MPDNRNILLVEDTLPVAYLYHEFLQADGYDVTLAHDGASAKKQLDSFTPAALILDLLLPDINGLEVLDYARRLYPNMPVIVVTINNSVDVAVEAMRRGAYDFIVKPFSSTRLLVTLRNSVCYRNLSREVEEWRQVVGVERFHHFVGQSPPMQAVYRIIEAVAHSDVSIFLTGENGTGKEMAAQAIHELSPRRNCPFIAINCAAVPPDLLESTLFGHVRGAFTGAVCDSPGAARSATGGTLFLDEICELPLEMQAKLLRFTQTGEVMPVGSSRTEFADVRIIAASNRNPREEVKEHRFREDLFYRLHVVPINMPPLRDRGDDLLLLASHFMAKYNPEESKNFSSLSPEVTSFFRCYDWPGNVRQLENVIRNVLVLHSGTTITEEMLPKDLQDFISETAMSADRGDKIRMVMPNDKTKITASIKPLWLIEKEAIQAALDHTGHDITRAAVLLDVSPSTLYRKLQNWKTEQALEASQQGSTAMGSFLSA